MQLTHTIRSVFIVIVAAGALTASAAAGGEPKNDWPFTRSVVARTAEAVTVARSNTQPATRGEPKNQPPFTRPATTGPATVVVRSSAGFSWADAAIGLVAGIGIAATSAGALTLTHKSPHTA